MQNIQYQSFPGQYSPGGSRMTPNLSWSSIPVSLHPHLSQSFSATPSPTEYDYPSRRGSQTALPYNELLNQAPLRTPRLQILDTLAFPYPKYWVKGYNLRPSIVVLIDTPYANNEGCIIVVTALHPNTRQPLADVKLDVCAEGVDDDLSGQLRLNYNLPAVRFKDLKLHGGKSVSSRKGHPIVLGFSLYSKHTFPPTHICSIVHDKPILVYNRYADLPAPEIMRIVPNRVISGCPIQLDVYGQLFKKGKEAVTFSITHIHEFSTEMSEQLLNASHPPGQPDRIVTVTSNSSRHFKIQLELTPGFYLISVSNDPVNLKFGYGRLIHVEHTPVLKNSELREMKLNVEDRLNRAPTSISTSSFKQGFEIDYLAYTDQKNAVTALLNKGVPVDSIDKQGNTPLMWATWGGHFELCHILILNGANVNHIDRHMETPLHIASRLGHVDIVRILLKKGADFNLKGSGGMTALHLAAGRGHAECVDVLMHAMPSPDIRDDTLSTPLHLASAIKHDHRSAILLTNYLFELGESVSPKDCEGNTPLHWAVENSSIELIETLLTCGARINSRNNEGETPLFYAFRNSDEISTKILLKNGAKTKLKNKDGLTVFDIQTSDAVRNFLTPDIPDTSNLKSPREVEVENTNFNMNPRFNLNNDEISILKEKTRELEFKLKELTLRFDNFQLGSHSTLQVEKPTPVKETPIPTRPTEISTFNLKSTSEFSAPGTPPRVSTPPHPAVQTTPGTPSTFNLNFNLNPAVPSSSSDEVPNAPNDEDMDVAPIKEKDASTFNLNPTRQATPPPAVKPAVSSPRPAVSSPKPAVDVSRAEYSESEDDRMTLTIYKDGDEDPLGEIHVDPEATLADARREIEESPDFPQQFVFWFEKMKCNVEEWQEAKIKAKICFPNMILVETNPEKSWWENRFNSTSANVSISTFVEGCLQDLNPTEIDSTVDPSDVKNVIHSGLTDFFTKINTREDFVSLAKLKTFLKLYGPVNKFLSKVYAMYKLPYFHGFISLGEATKLLNGRPGTFLLRYSQSRIEEGFFALNVNKASKIENYALGYHDERFQFDGKEYDTVEKFVQDEVYHTILKEGIVSPSFRQRRKSEDDSPLHRHIPPFQDPDALLKLPVLDEPPT
eukprot:TRINITY_DN3880_c1_g1_i7.p1 TRINITY_DN3880_c1_g1~~TRINITY_DN3880_c1_g1_i7.p1  ORF type:complete len:1123 (-),score=391.60 TRINITY_DN3880_c1_g1_i7:17-3385(-)